MHCILLQGSKIIESENQLARVLYNPNNQSSIYRNSLFYGIVINFIKYSHIITIPQFYQTVQLILR